MLLPDHHTAVFEDGENPDTIANARPQTKLIEYFATKSKYPGYFYIGYLDFPKYFTWKKLPGQPNTWHPRAKCRTQQRGMPDLLQFSGP